MTTVNELAPAYHAHIYFDANTRLKARALIERISDDFTAAEVGTLHEKNVGPYPRWSCQVKFSLQLFSAIVPWLMLNRDGLTIFLHPLTGDGIADHQQSSLWMGEILPLNMEPLLSMKQAAGQA